MNEYLRAIAMLAPVLLSLSTAAAYAQNTLESVSATMQSESQVVRVDFSRPLTEVPAGFLVQSPARIALDFPGTSSAVGRSAIRYYESLLDPKVAEEIWAEGDREHA